MSVDSRPVLALEGEACGTLTPRIRDALRALPGGGVVEVVSDDPASRVGIPAWCRLAGHTLLESRELDELRTSFVIRKKEVS